MVVLLSFDGSCHHALHHVFLHEQEEDEQFVREVPDQERPSREELYIAPSRLYIEIPYPAVLLQLLYLIGWESSPIAYSGVAFHIAKGAHAWNHGRDNGITQDVAQCDLWKLTNCFPQIGYNVLGTLVHFLFPVVPEVATAEILRIEVAFRGDRACKTTFVKGNTHDYPDVVVLAGWKERIFWALLKNVVDDLNRIHDAGFYESERVVWLMIVNRDPEKANLPLIFESLDGLRPISLPNPLIIPDMELLKINGLRPKIVQTLLGTFSDVGAWKGLFDWDSVLGRPLAILWWNLGGHDNTFVWVVAQDLADKLFAVPVTIGQGCINTVHTQVDGPLEGMQ
jgi:hypothetical protein